MLKTLLKLFAAIGLILALSCGGSNAHESHKHSHGITRSHHHVRYHHGHGHFHRYEDGRPSAWCGWQMRQWFPGHETDRPGLNLDMAHDWARVGASTDAHIGAVVVWPHHVGVITGFDSHSLQWIVKSGNSGRHHTVTEHPRSLAVTIAIRSL